MSKEPVNAEVEHRQFLDQAALVSRRLVVRLVALDGDHHRQLIAAEELVKVLSYIRIVKQWEPSTFWRDAGSPQEYLDVVTQRLADGRF
jgi:hypothetical protein